MPQLANRTHFRICLVRHTLSVFLLQPWKYLLLTPSHHGRASVHFVSECLLTQPSCMPQQVPVSVQSGNCLTGQDIVVQHAGYV